MDEFRLYFIITLLLRISSMIFVGWIIFKILVYIGVI